MAPWDTPHLAAGAPEPRPSPDTITLYNMRFCPFAERTMLVLLEKKLPFETVNINLNSKPEWFVANTWGAVSVVRHHGEHIMDSLVTSDYIDSLAPDTLLHPTDPLQRALGRLVVERCGKIIYTYYGILKAERAEAVKLWPGMVKVLREMEDQLARQGSRFLSGEKAGMTDLMVWPGLERFPCLAIRHPGAGMELPAELTHLRGWIKAMWGVDSVKQYGLRPEDHSKFYEKYLAGEMPDYDILLGA